MRIPTTLRLTLGVLLLALPVRAAEPATRPAAPIERGPDCGAGFGGNLDLPPLGLGHKVPVGVLLPPRRSVRLCERKLARIDRSALGNEREWPGAGEHGNPPPRRLDAQGDALH